MRRAAFLRGALTCAPVAVSVIPFAVIVAVSAIETGMSGASTAGLSLIVFAGAAQLAALELARTDAPALFVIGAAVVVNLRFAMYSASLAPHLRPLPRRTRAVMAYLLTDQAYALSLAHYRSGRPLGAWFFLGAGAALWTAWQLGTAAGIVLGGSVPPQLSLDFAVALAFIGLAVPALTSRPAVLAGATSVVVFLLASALPYGLALLPAAVAGIIAGNLADRSTA